MKVEQKKHFHAQAPTMELGLALPVPPVQVDVVGSDAAPLLRS